jgi:hypothetical protein
LWSNTIHEPGDRQVGEPLFPECSHHTRHALFDWHVPEWAGADLSSAQALDQTLADAGRLDQPDDAHTNDMYNHPRVFVPTHRCAAN